MDKPKLGQFDRAAKIVGNARVVDAIVMPSHGFSTYLSGLLESVQESLDCSNVGLAGC